MKRVVVGLSGGVDSSVAAYLLKEQGYDVVALFMRNWHDTEGTLSGSCTYEDDRLFAEMVARKLDLPFHFVDLSEQYRKRVVDYMFDEYERGRTPNPDVLCNREIKFDAFVEEALRLGADYVATGHYCRKDEVTEADGTTAYRLLAGLDRGKDQSYFLCQLSQKQLERALFPIGHLEKSEVRRIAALAGLATAERKDSQGICFVGKVDLPVFLQQKLKAKSGDIIEIEPDSPVYDDRHNDIADSSTVEPSLLPALSEPYRYTAADGRKVGTHNGAHFFTVGQRKGLGVGGKAEPLFVIAIDTADNIIYTGQGHSHPGLLRRALFMDDGQTHWIRASQRLLPGQRRRYMMRIRYRQPLQSGTLYATAEGLYMVFDSPQRGITPGQFATWYADDGELVGSGVIDK
ncbi:MAG: tRNA 2-thiouridine(34) synthase MnmA [Rikenellaceae bacterium]|nr:tRNA 2-thiouridine(34) synthase MnmA [Rikenellaceae bacterium]